jgi:anti-sigma B factor antagonist
LFVVEPLEHRSGEKRIPVFGNKTTGIDKPEIEIVSCGNGAMARFCGRIDIDSSPALRAQLLTALQAPGCNVLTVDVSAVTQIDSSGVATLIEALRIARSHHADLRLIGLQGRLLRLFQSTGILSLFNGSTRADSEYGSQAV